jgi:hypothetical protein
MFTFYPFSLLRFKLSPSGHVTQRFDPFRTQERNLRYVAEFGTHRATAYIKETRCPGPERRTRTALYSRTPSILSRSSIFALLISQVEQLYHGGLPDY